MAESKWRCRAMRRDRWSFQVEGCRFRLGISRAERDNDHPQGRVRAVGGQLTADRARKRLTLLMKKGKSRTVIVTRAARKGAKERTVRVASRARSSS